MSTTIDQQQNEKRPGGSSSNEPATPPGTTDEAPSGAAKPRISNWALAMSLLIGIYFGLVLAKSEVARWQRIHDMFLFKEAFMYLIIGVAIAVAMVSMLIIKKLHARTVEGEPIVYKPKPFHKGVVIGGTLFGAGWAITGACPGPIYAQIGGGASMALFTLAGALAGMFLYANFKPKLPH